MRRETFRMPRAEALALLERAPGVHVAGLTERGAPLLRTVHGVVLEGALAFHGARAGEKREAVGKEVVVSAEELVAPIPSYFTDPERACPATTFYRSAQAHGVLERVSDPASKVAVLDALMRKYQPEGGHVAIAADHPLYQKAVAGIEVLSVKLEVVDGKATLAQNRSPEERARLLEQLWARGLPGDARAVDLVRLASPDTPTPDFLRAPAGATLLCALGEDDAEAAALLVRDAYWNEGIDVARLVRAHVSSTAWVGARDEAGSLIATARAISDGAKHAHVYDVLVVPAWRGRGLGEAVVRLLLDHPAVRGARKVRLGTRDAQGLYAKLGFREEATMKRRFAFTEMALLRAGD